MRLLIYGGNGWIGGQFCKYLDSENVEYILGAARTDDTVAVEAEILKRAPTHVVSLVGRTSGVHEGKRYNTIDYLEQPGKLVLNVRDNLFSPISLALLCKKYTVHFTYLGTGCIFSYDDRHDVQRGFVESDTPNFTGSSYSTVKGFTDRLMHQLPVLNLRIRMPIADHDHPRNFISKITRYEHICSIPNSMTVLRDFYPVWLDMLKKGTTGTFNCTNPGVISHNEILEMYKELVDRDFTWKNFSIEEQAKILDSGRSNNFLDTKKLEKEYQVPKIRDSVQKVLKDWQK